MSNKHMVLLLGDVILWVILVLVPFPKTVHAEGCPDLVPVPIDETILFNKQPPKGFFPAFGSGEDRMPKYTRKPLDVKGIIGPNKVCIKTRLKVSGREVLSPMSVECSYSTSPASLFCDMSNVGGGAAGAIAAAGLKVPTVTIGTIVDTDNSTYIAYGTCLDGAVYEWVILTATEPKTKKVNARTLKALHIDKKTLEESAKKKYSAGTTQILKGPCVAGGGGGGASVPIVGKLGDSLGKLFIG